MRTHVYIRRRTSLFLCLFLFILSALSNRSAACCLYAAANPSVIGRQSTLPFRPTVPILNEYMANNKSIISDEDGDSSDWIEIYNPGPDSLSLEGWTLTDRADKLTQWRFPAVTMAPDSYLLVFASGKDRAQRGAPLHTNFKLKSSGEYVALVDPERKIVDQSDVPFAPQFPNIAYGKDRSGVAHYLTEATPGSTNAIPANLGPAIVALEHTPAIAVAGEPLTIHARIRPNGEAIERVQLALRIGLDAAQNFAMAPERPQADADGTLAYSVQIPGTLFTEGELLRYAVSAVGLSGHSTRWPNAVAYTEAPHFFGTIAAASNVSSPLELFHRFLEDPEAAATDRGTRGAVFYRGVLYDNVLLRVRGVTSRNVPKQSFKVDFNDGYPFEIAAGFAPVTEININSNIYDTTHMRQTLAWETFRDAGSPYSYATPLRVQQNNQFFGLFTLVEQVDESYLARHGLDENGALYKVNSNRLENSGYRIDKKTRLDEGKSDLLALINGIHQPGALRTQYLFDNINIPAVVNFLAIHALLNDWDFMVHNYYLYRDSEGSAEWMLLPWDKDLIFLGLAADDINSHPLLGSEQYPILIAESNLRQWNHLYDALYDTPPIREMYLRRLRTLMDALLQAPELAPEERSFERRVSELSDLLEPDAALDATAWAPSLDFQSSVAWMLEQGIQRRRENLYGYYTVASGATGIGIIPDAQSPSPLLQFSDVIFNGQDQRRSNEYFVLFNPNDDAVDISHWTIRGDIGYTFQPGTVIPAFTELYVTEDVRDFRTQSRQPSGGNGLFIQGGYQGQLNDAGGAMNLYDSAGNAAASTIYGAEITKFYLPFVALQ